MGFDFLDFGFPRSGTDWKSINGKPYITVSSKGRSNGLSNKINDGADFGPDTTLNATSPSQTGPPYSPTLGIMEAINSLPKVYNIFTERYVPVGKIFLKNGLYVITQPIITYEDWSVMIEGEQAPSGGIPGSQPETTIIGANDIGVLFTLTANITGKGADPDVYGGQIYLKNLALMDFYTDTSGTYHQYNYSTGYTDLKGHVINYLLFSCYSTPDTIILENVNIQTDTANGSDYNSSAFIQTNLAETLVQFKGEINMVSNTKYHPVLFLTSYHFIADTIDIGTNNAPSTYTQYYPRFPTFSYVAGPRNFISTVHIGGNDIFPLWVGGAPSFIGTIFFEINQPVLGTNGQPPICGNVTDTLTGQFYDYNNFTVANGTSLTVGSWTCTEWNPLKSGYISGPIAGGGLGLNSNAPYLQILQIQISDLGTPFNPNAGSNTGWSGQAASSPLTNSPNWGGIKLPANIGLNNYYLSLNPSVPASGTAQQNTGPIPVDVYLYGGSVTQIQITRNGTAFTVFSNATGLALSGQVYKLEPTDSITITYTTAPTWTWLPAK